MPLSRFRFVVHGRVQGVGFRFGTEAQARRLGLSGFARNTPDGTVEVEAEGEAAALDDFARWLGEGPRGASVTGVDRTELPATGGAGFDIRH